MKLSLVRHATTHSIPKNVLHLISVGIVGHNTAMRRKKVKRMDREEAEKRWKEMVRNIVHEKIRELIQISITCPYCGKKYTIEELGKWEEGEQK